ncbi:MAG: type II toxin-antitoxin system prevent-host-death family antitoxin [Bifidobacteriaceae bacterium]|nr:type II toxin-antitoxin system prevent-host-death family antitoxin [Bifidobacteriaceae bacterium]
MPIMSLREAREHFADVVDRAPDQPTILTRRGREVAAVISIDALRHYEQLEEAEINRIIDERMENRAQGIPIEDVMAETLARND